MANKLKKKTATVKKAARAKGAQTSPSERALRSLALLLAKGQPMTGKQIAARTKCCKLSAYNRVRALSERGIKVQSKRVRESTCGNFSRAFWVEKNRAFNRLVGTK